LIDCTALIALIALIAIIAIIALIALIVSVHVILSCNVSLFGSQDCERTRIRLLRFSA